MSETIALEISGEQTQRLSDLHGVLHDLKWVQAACVLALRLVSDPAASAVLTEALQAAAVIRYCRSFKNDSRAAFSLRPEMLETLPVHLQRAHFEFCVLRDTYIAPTEKDGLWNIPTAHFQNDSATGAHRAAWLTVQHYSVISLSKESLGHLYSLALALVKQVRAEAGKEEAMVLDQLKARSATALKQDGDPQAYAPCDLQ